MKIDDIEAFVAVVRHQSISQAADAMQLTQPAITRRVQNFEEALGVLLLDRNTKPPKPTAIGRQVHAQCRVVLREIEALRQMVASETGPSGALRLGLTQGIADLALLQLLPALQAAYPALQAKVTTGWGGHLMQQVEADELDAAMVWMAAPRQFPKGVAARSLARSQLVVVARQGEFSQRKLGLADCHARGWVLNPDGCGFRAGLQRALAALGLPLKVQLDTFGSDTQLGLVAQGHGLGLVPLPQLEGSPHRDALVALPLSDFKPQIDLWLLQGRSLGRLGPAVEQVAQQVLACYPGLATPTAADNEDSNRVQQPGR